MAHIAITAIKSQYATHSKKWAATIHARAIAVKSTKNVTVHKMQTFSTSWLIAAVVCILALAVYAALLWRKVWQTQHNYQQQQAEQKRLRRDDLIVLANGFLTEQMPWAEGCIRIKVILDHYDTELTMHPDYQVLQSVFSATEHIPTHDAWRALSSAEKQPFTQLLNELELQHKQASVIAVKQLLGQLQN